MATRRRFPTEPGFVEKRKECSGMFVFTWNQCRDWLDTRAALCDSSVHVEFFFYPDVNYVRNIFALFDSLKNDNTSLVFLGMGIWDWLNVTMVESAVLTPLMHSLMALNTTASNASGAVNSAGPVSQISSGGREPQWARARPCASPLRPTSARRPLLVNSTDGCVHHQLYNSETRPRLVWLNTHCPGLVKMGNGVQGKENVSTFNAAMSEFFHEWGVPVLDTFRMTEHVVSVDESHYGLSVNKLKALVVLHYISTL